MICWMETPWSRLLHRTNNRSPISYYLFSFATILHTTIQKCNCHGFFLKSFQIVKANTSRTLSENICIYITIYFTIMLQGIRKRYKENLIIFIFNFLERILKFITFGNNFFNFPYKQFVGLVWCTFCCCCYFFDNLHALFWRITM